MILEIHQISFENAKPSTKRSSRSMVCTVSLKQCRSAVIHRAFFVEDVFTTNPRLSISVFMDAAVRDVMHCRSSPVKEGYTTSADRPDGPLSVGITIEYRLVRLTANANEELLYLRVQTEIETDRVAIAFQMFL
jgi:hypothetical protein